MPLKKDSYVILIYDTLIVYEVFKIWYQPLYLVKYHIDFSFLWQNPLFYKNSNSSYTVWSSY